MKLNKGDSFLVISDINNYNKIINSLTKLKEKVLYVSLNKPDSLIKGGRNYFFISSLCKSSRCLQLETIQSLTDLSILISQEIEKRKYDYLIIDSVTTLLIYNSETTTIRFLHFIVNKMRLFNVKPVLLITNDEKNVINQLMQLVSKVIKA